MIHRPPPSRARSAARRRPRGVSLVELVIAVAISSVLLVGLGSALAIAARSVDDGTSADARSVRAGELAGRIATDASQAISFTKTGPTDVAFRVADRDGDGKVETLRYRLVAGELVYHYNERPPALLADDVSHFDLGYVVRTVPGSGPVMPPESVESAELELVAHDDAPGGTFETGAIDDDDHVAQYVAPELPNNTISWSITRVLWSGSDAAAAGGTDQTLRVEVTDATDELKPGSLVLDEVLVPEATLGGTIVWQEAAFDALVGLDPARGYCLVLRAETADAAATVQWERDGSPMTSGTHRLESHDGGASWTDPAANDDLRFYLYGTVTTAGPPEWP